MFTVAVKQQHNNNNKASYFLVGIWCQNDVALTSMRRHHDASTLIRHHFSHVPAGLKHNGPFVRLTQYLFAASLKIVDCLSTKAEEAVPISHVSLRFLSFFLFFCSLFIYFLRFLENS